MPTGFEKAIFPEYRRFLTYLRIHLPPSLSILFSVIPLQSLTPFPSRPGFTLLSFTPFLSRPGFTLLSFTPFLSRPGFTLLSFTPFPVSPRGEKLLPMDTVAQFVISNNEIRIPSQY
jgi:hypothetical protein